MKRLSNRLLAMILAGTVILGTLMTGAPTEAARNWPVLGPGDQNENVFTLQAMLIARGYLAADAGHWNGLYDTATEQAVRNYQSSNSLYVDGYAGSQTWNSIAYWVTAGNRIIVTEALERQLVLKYGYDIIYRDDYFGAGTDAAVRAFQQWQGLVVDGIVGHDTWARLMSATGPAPLVSLPAECEGGAVLSVSQLYTLETEFLNSGLFTTAEVDTIMTDPCQVWHADNFAFEPIPVETIVAGQAQFRYRYTTDWSKDSSDAICGRYVFGYNIVETIPIVNRSIIVGVARVEQFVCLDSSLTIIFNGTYPNGTSFSTAVDSQKPADPLVSVSQAPNAAIDRLFSVTKAGLGNTGYSSLSWFPSRVSFYNGTSYAQAGWQMSLDVSVEGVGLQIFNVGPPSGDTVSWAERQITADQVVFDACFEGPENNPAKIYACNLLNDPDF